MAKTVIANVQKINDVAPQMDDTDKQAVSIYGNSSAAGDTSVLVDSNGRVSIVTPNTVGDTFDGGPAGFSLDDSATGRPMASLMMAHNGINNEMNFWRNNIEITLLASASRTTETNSTDQINYNGTGLILYIDFATEVSSVTLTPNLQIKDSISNAYSTIWSASANLTAVGDTTYLFTPGGAAGSYTEAVNLRIPRTWRFQMGVGNTDQAGYSVSAVVLV